MTSHEGTKTRRDLIQPESNSRFDRVASILEHASAIVVRTVNSIMVLGYWLIGPEKQELSVASFRQPITETSSRISENSQSLSRKADADTSFLICGAPPKTNIRIR